MGSKSLLRKGYARPFSLDIKKPQTILPKWTIKMNAPTDISMKTNDVLRIELEVIRQEHRDLDESINALATKGTADQLMLQRLKRTKLRLKDKISQIEDRLTPDIIA